MTDRVHDDLIPDLTGKNVYYRYGDMLNLEGKYITINNSEVMYVKKCNELHPNELDHRFTVTITYGKQNETIEHVINANSHDRFHIKDGFPVPKENENEPILVSISRISDVVGLKGKYVKINDLEVFYIKDVKYINNGKHGAVKFRITYNKQNDTGDYIMFSGLYDKYYLYNGFPNNATDSS